MNREDSPWIQTLNGKRFYFLDPVIEDIDIRDIAGALSKQCRFAGHINKFYSVAEHSVLVSYLALDPLEGLLHDASEAYLVDMPSPIKAELQSYRDLESSIMVAIGKRFNTTWPISEDTHDADRAMLIEEARSLMTNCQWVNDPKYQPKLRKHGIVPQALNPDDAYVLFMNRFKQLTGYKDELVQAFPKANGTYIPAATVTTTAYPINHNVVYDTGYRYVSVGGIKN